MNRLSYRIVFNAARGQLVAVAECASSHGKGCGERSARTATASEARGLRSTIRSYLLGATALAAWLSVQSGAVAQVIADPSAPANQRATVLTNPMGGPLVNIQTPSAAGVSRNTYSQFDVGSSQTVILNNNRYSNPWLATGSARVILNEVNSSNPSNLGGQITVDGATPAGTRPDVVFANPSGININGASFTGAGRVTLTTGTPVINSGALTSFNVTTGVVDVGSTGMVVNGTGSFADIISRSAVVGGAVRVDQAINVLTGPQSVDYTTGSITPLAGTGTKPTLAIDTKALGGMYAGSITMLSTEAGVGVRNQGTLQANTGSGQLIVTADGRLENTGRMDSAYTSVATVVGNIDNSGALLGRKLLMASAGGDFTQAGAGMIQDAGSASQVFVNAQQDVQLLFGASISSNASETAQDGSVSKGQVVLNAGRHVGLQANSTLSANGDIQISSQGGTYATWNRVSSGSGDVSILARETISLSGSSIDGSTVHLETGAAFEDTASNITISGGSVIGTKQTAVIATGDLNLSTAGTNGVKSTYGNVYLKAGKNISVAAGSKTMASQHLTAVAGDTIGLQGIAGTTAETNQVVSMFSGGDTTLSASKVVLQGSNLEAWGSIEIEASKSDILIQAQPDQSLNTHSAYSLNASSCCASSPIQTAGTNTASSLKAGNALSISAYNGNIFAAGIQASGADVNIISNGITRIDRVENIGTSTYKLPIQSNITSSGDLVVASMNKNGAVELIGSKLAAAGHAKVFGSAAVNLTSTITNHTLTNGSKVTTVSRAEISGGNVTVQGGTFSAEGVRVDAKSGHANVGALDGGISLNFGGTSYTEILASGNIAVHANQGIASSNAIMNAGQNLAVTSANKGIATNNNQLTAKKVLSISSQGAQTHTSSQYEADTLSLFNATGSQVIAKSGLKARGIAGVDAQSVSGALAVESGNELLIDATSRLNANTDISLASGLGDLVIDPGQQIGASRDLNILARGGSVKLTALAGTSGNPSSKLTTLSAGRDLNLTGASVQLQAPNLSAARDANITSHGGAVLIDGVKSSFANYVPREQVNKLVNERPRYDSYVAAEAAKLEANAAYASLRSQYIATEAAPLSSFGTTWFAAGRKADQLASLRSQMAPYEVALNAAKKDRADLDGLITTLSSGVKGAEHLGAKIVGQNINVTSAAGLAVFGAEITGSGSVNLRSAGVLPVDPTASTELQKPTGALISGLSDFYEYGKAGDSKHAFTVLSRPTAISGISGVNIKAAGTTTDIRLVLNDSAVTSTAGTVALQSLGDMKLEAGQEEFYSKAINTYTSRKWHGAKKTTTEIRTRQSVIASPVMLEGKNIALKSGGSIDAEATEFLAPKGSVQITAANALNLYAVDEVSINKFDATTRSSFLGVTYSKSSTASSLVVSEKLPSNMVAQMVNTTSGWDTKLEGTTIQTSLAGASIAAGVGPNARADAQVILDGIKKTVTESKTKESNYVVWQRQLGSGSTVETMTLPSFTGPTPPVFNAPGGLTVQVPAGEFTTQIQTLSQQPGMSYLNVLTQRKDVNWQPVKLAFDQWSYKQEGLTPAGAALLAVAVSFALPPGAGADLLGSALNTHLTGATAVMADAAFMSLASQAAITLVNNKGNIGKTLSDLAKSDIVKATIAAALTAGAMAQLNAIPGMTELSDKLKSGQAGLSEKLTYNLINASGRALTNTAISGGDLADALKQALVGGLVDTAHGEVASQIGAKNLDYVSHKLAHALAGCVAGAAAGGACRDGAIGGAVGEIVGEMFKSQVPDWNASDETWAAFDAKVKAYGKLVSGTVAAYAGGNAQTAITTAEIAIDNNTRISMRAQAAQQSLSMPQYFMWVRAQSLQQAITLNGGSVPPNMTAPGARVNYTQSDITRLEGQLRSLSPNHQLVYSAPTATLSPLPYSYVSMQTAVNMNNVPGATGSNAFGFPSGNIPYFRELLRQQPQMLSPTNQVRIGRGQAPQVDAQWIQHNPTHQSFTGQTLHHYHMFQSNIAVAIPQSIHRQWSSTFHPYR